MERIPLHLEDYVGKLNEELARHPECLPGMQIIIQHPELKYSYEICDPARDPNKPGSLNERIRVGRLNRLLSLDRFWDSRCHSRLSLLPGGAAFSRRRGSSGWAN